jgi:hypothetical protein
MQRFLTFSCFLQRRIAFVKNIFATAAIAAVVSCTFAAPYSHAQGTLLARGTLTGSKAGSYRDFPD